MEMVGAPQVAPSVFMHRHGSGQFCPVPLIGRKRSLVYDHNQQDQLQVVRRDGGDAWNPKAWHWDNSRFVAKPLEPGLIHTAQTKDRDTTLPINSLAEEGTDTLRLRLGGAGSTTGKSGLAVEELASSRPNKKLRSGSPSGSSYAICQVDNCKEDLSNSMDYHWRHKVCEVHNKSTKALVGKQMQRFCQQCSRFHPLSEFDEGKRSCRRRLAGHNWRRRKTQPDDAASQVLHPEYPGRLEPRICTCQSLPEGNQRIQIEVAAKLRSSANLNKSSLEEAALDQSNLSVDAASESTVDLLAVLSATLSASTSDSFGLLSHIINRGSGCEKNSLTETDQDMCFNSLEQKILEFQPVRGERSSSSYQPPSDDSDCQTTSENAQADQLPLSGLTNANLESCKTGTNDSSTTLELFTVTKRGTTSKSVRTSAYQAGYTSSGSDCSPPSFSSDVQESTGRIIFKLFDKDPSHLPGTLRTQIYNWLSNRPSEMESYIWPGCIILSLYVSMLPAARSQFEENLHQHVSTLIHGSDSDFWRSGRFLVHLGKHMASYKDGMIRVCKIWSTWCSPELLSVSPLAIVGGQDTSLKLRGRNLTNPGTRIHCTYMGDYTVKEVLGPNCEGTICEAITLSGFKAAPTVLGRCFIEVESGLKGNSFPVIIAGAKICQELSVLENEFSIGHNVISEDQVQNSGGSSTQEELLHFLNELGWLFQRKLSSELGGPDYKLERFQFLFTFSIE
ncbi:Squamosa promoter-binding-like protein [Ancistrocladus abbreviatus]